MNNLFDVMIAILSEPAKPSQRGNMVPDMILGQWTEADELQWQKDYGNKNK